MERMCMLNETPMTFLGLYQNDIRGIIARIALPLSG